MRLLLDIFTPSKQHTAAGRNWLSCSLAVSQQVTLKVAPVGCSSRWLANPAVCACRKTFAVFHSSTHLRNHVEKDSDGVTTADGVAKLLEVAGEALDEEPTEDTREDKLDNSMTPIDLESLFFEINSISQDQGQRLNHLDRSNLHTRITHHTLRGCS